MSDAVAQTIELVQQQVEAAERDVAEKKRMVNSLCKLIGRSPLYSNIDESAEQITTSIRSDEFYGQPLALVVRRVLDKRKASNIGAATVNEIYDAMLRGGFKFETDVAENAKRNLRISLTKNSVTFHKLPNGRYGLLEWYPGVKSKKMADDRSKSTANEGDDVDDDEIEAEEFREAFEASEKAAN